MLRPRQVGCTGPTGELAAALTASIAEIWARYPPGRDCVQRLAGTAAGRRQGQLQRLLGPDAITLPRGEATSARAALAVLQREVDETAEGVTGSPPTRRCRRPCAAS